MAMRRIGQIFIDLGFINDDQLEAHLEEQQNRRDELLGQVAESMSMITDDQLAQALAEQMHMQVISLGEVVVPPEVLAYVTEPMAQLYRIVPVSFKDGTLVIAMCDPQKLAILDELRNFLGYVVRAVVATERDIKNALERYYATSESVETLITDMQQEADSK